MKMKYSETSTGSKGQLTLLCHTSGATIAKHFARNGTKQRLLLTGIILCFVLTLTLAQPAGMSNEERIVRTTYARLSYATQVGVVHHAISDFEADKNTVLDQAELARRLKNAELTFELSDFKVGN